VGKTADVAMHLLDWGACYSQNAWNIVSLLMPTGESVGRLMREGRRDAAFFRLVYTQRNTMQKKFLR
jgi:hypothetical protein